MTCAVVGGKEDKLKSKSVDNDPENRFYYQTLNVRIRRIQVKVDQSAACQGSDSNTEQEHILFSNKEMIINGRIMF